MNWRGEVTRVTGGTAWVIVAAQWPGQEIECAIFCDPKPSRGDRVLVADVGGDTDDLAVIGVRQ